MADKDHDFARCGLEKRVGEGASDAPQPPVGVEECRPGVEADAHRSLHATPSVRWSVVVPTKAGWPHLARTLPPLLAALGADDEAVIVGDGRDPGLPDETGRQCRTVIHDGPAGFAPVCNRGAAASRGAMLLFLNDDVVVPPGVLGTLERALADPGIGAVGPNVLSETLGRSESGTSLRWHHGVLEARQSPLDGAGCVPVPYLCGAALAIRRGDFERLGGFDERLAPYFWEDVDLSIRTRGRVGATAVACGATVVHRHGATIRSEPERERRAVYERNRLLVSWRHLHGWRWLPHLGWLPLRLAGSVVRDRAVLLGFVRAFGSLRSKRSRDARRG
jgi:GT2 family glycosyltransferase